MQKLSKYVSTCSSSFVRLSAILLLLCLLDAALTEVDRYPRPDLIRESCRI
ncbi:hypothetical protein ACRRTK_015170 [Alexandromys fortis]